MTIKKLGMRHILTICLTSALLSGCESYAISNDGSPTSKKTIKKRPNFVWLVSEDNSKRYLKLYNAKGAEMPNIESLAKQGLVFNNAFSNSPVCSTARTTLALGAYPAKLAMEYHRPFERINLPRELSTISDYLTKAGYYTSNDAKEDYNFVSPENNWSSSKKGASWHNRKAGQPFFHMQTWKTTHEGKLHFPESDIENLSTIHNPNSVELDPIHPNTELFRYTYARYLDLHKKVDKEMGVVINQLKEEGLLEDTFIFYFGDHGGVLPGSKGFVSERGLNVPLVVRVPKNFRHLLHKDLQAKLSTRVDGVISFIDFAPTLLELAGLPKSKLQDGESFLSKNLSLDDLNKRNTNFSFADRFDEKYDMVRGFRKGKYKYIRNYLPFNPDGLFSSYRYKQAAYREWKHLFKANKLNSVQSAFFKRKPLEALYDLEQDPFETKNLALLPQYTEQVIKMRAGLQKKLQSMPDLAFYPESYLVDIAKDDPIIFSLKHKNDIARFINIIDMSLQPFEQVKNKLKAVLLSNEQWERYWAMNAVLAFGDKANEFLPIIEKIRQSDINLINRSRAIQYLALNNGVSPQLELEDLVKQAKDPLTALAILNIATQLHDTLGIAFNIELNKLWKNSIETRGTSMESFHKRTVDGWFKARMDYLKNI
ncbi:sulfatase family protein [Pseudoalteromonas distincta]|uniref:sulfatase family protein n=1 Tax=Pseudoalteromonas distincta TaxID=77608 RepID=UPI0011F2D9FB|nr:sulfatase [Pseudoalteromonas distincta]KAA1160867.1 sulfatase [Pseudoalteromonas distincta]